MAQRLQAFHGGAGPAVDVQVLAEAASKVWKKPGSGVWHADKGGDKRNHVHRLRIPARPTYGKPPTVSAQYNPSTRTVVAFGVRQNFLDYLVQWVGTFGPVVEVGTGTQTAGTTSVTQFLQKAAK